MSSENPPPVVIPMVYEDGEVEVDLKDKEIAFGSTRGKGSWRRDYLTADQARGLAKALTEAADALKEREQRTWP